MTGGAGYHSRPAASRRAHQHQYAVGANLAPGTNARGASGDGTSMGYPNTEVAGGNAAHNTLPPMLMTSYIIKC